MSDTRILVVDDSVVVRKLVTDQLGSVPGLEVVGTAANGKIALRKVELERPDVVVLDVEMPVMDGLETLREIKRREEHPLVIMFSSFTTKGAQVTVDALALGAEDYVAKPTNLLDAEQGAKAIRDELAGKIQLLTGQTPTPRKPAPPKPTRVVDDTPPSSIDVLAIGSSTGGPNALAEFFSRLPRSFPVPILIVQHMPAIFTPHLADRLARESVLEVHEAEDGTVAQAGHAYIAPGGRHLKVTGSAAKPVLRLDDSPPVHSCRPAADVLFTSVHETYGRHCLAAVLTGMGEDGLAGARLIREGGGRVLIQDEASSVVWGMAGAISRAGLADAELPVLDLADEIIHRARVGRSK